MSAGDPQELRYEGFRIAARQMTTDDMYGLAQAGHVTRDILLGLHLSAIDDEAMAAWRRQWTSKRFAWDRIAGQTRSYIRRFEVAIWLGESLEGLCIGRSSRSIDNITIHFVERRREHSS